ncbi:MAG: hypothetical protein GEU76_13655 [Alphaproteobacteria bacterium]|nr:hypothetical protein [Alphaproteobacteria bacterium]
MTDWDLPSPESLQEKFLKLITKGATGNAGSYELIIAERGRMRTVYAPFDYCNPHSVIAFVGLTPGRVQMQMAINEFKEKILAGNTIESALQSAKNFASFGGPMRHNLIAMLDFIGVHKRLGIESCASLFSANTGLAHFTSILRYPIFLGENNYSGSPVVGRCPFLKAQVESWFGSEMPNLSGKIIIPLGRAVADVLTDYVRSGKIKESDVLSGLPHPSGANAERISYFLNKKRRTSLSSKTNADELDAVRAALIQKLAIS